MIDPKNFEAELKALLKKYNAEMSIREGWSGAAWAMVSEGITVEFESIYAKNGVLMRAGSTLELPSTIFGE